MLRPLIGSSVRSGFLPVCYVIGRGYHDVEAAHQKMRVAMCLLEEEILLTMDGKAVDFTKMQALRSDFEGSYEAYLKAFRKADGDVWEHAVTSSSRQQGAFQHTRVPCSSAEVLEPMRSDQKDTAEHQT